MNYLSHFYIHQKPNNAYYNLGLILPDFARANVASFKVEPHLSQAAFIQIYQGCMAHYSADKIFHSSTFFTHYTEQYKNILYTSPFSKSFNRRWFLAHILFEMMIDRLLINHQIKVCVDFYNNLQNIDEATLALFVKNYQCKNLDVLLKNFNHFCQAKYIFKYADNNSFVYSINRVLQQAGVTSKATGISDEDKIVLQQCIDKIEQSIFKNAQQILFELKSIYT